MQRSNEELFKDSYQMQNVKQLDEAVDSLIIEFEKRHATFYKYLCTAFYNYARMDSVARPYPKPDSAQVLRSDFLSSFDRKDKVMIADMAMANARSAFSELQFNENDFRVKREYISKHKIEWHRKFTLSFACLVLFFIGAPLGAIIRRGGLGLPVVFATLFFIIFHVISMVGEKFVKEGVMPAYEGMWLSSLVFLPIGVLLTYSASTDAPLLDLEVWKSIFKRMTFWKRPLKPGENENTSDQQ
jgi:lipopolysaccharide export system permease protein